MKCPQDGIGSLEGSSLDTSPGSMQSGSQAAENPRDHQAPAFGPK